VIAHVLPARMAKEIRGLGPAWLACLVTLAVTAAVGGRLRALGLAGYCLGAVVLGALSVGHEYTSRTLTTFLSQPSKRERLFLEKLSILVAMLLVLLAVAWAGLFDPTAQWGFGAGWARGWWVVAFGLPLLCGVFVAPWLTMACRNPLAGAVFTVAVPAIVWIAGDIASAMTYGGDLSATVEARDFALEVFVRLMLIICAVGAVAGWRMFMRLEAIDSRGLHVRVPDWLLRRLPDVGGVPSTRKHPLWLLAKKEFRLQQLTFAISGLYVVGWIGLVMFSQFTPSTRATLLMGSTFFHLGMIPLLAGSMASAEERQLGTLEWQVLLPMAGWTQWVVKVATALGVALVLTLGLPALLLYFTASPEVHGEVAKLTSARIAYFVVPMVAAGLYISSLSANGLRALLTSVPVMFVVIGLMTVQYIRMWFSTLSMWQRWRSMYNSWTAGKGDAYLDVYLHNYGWLPDVVVILVYVGVVGLLLRFALTNHRSAERGSGRMWKQMMRLAAFLAIAATVLLGASRPYASALSEQRQLERRKWADISGEAMNSGHRLEKQYTVVVFPEVLELPNRHPYLIQPHADGGFEISWLRPGQYAFVAVQNLDQRAFAREDPELLLRLRALAARVTFAAGDSKALTLMIAPLN